MKNIQIQLSVFLVFLSFSVFSLEIPRMSAPVVDKAGVLTQSQSTNLNKILRRVYNNGKGPQFQVLIVSTLSGEPIENYAVNVFTKWKIGDEKRDDGLLFLIAIDDRKMRVETGQGLEGDITDIQANNAINSAKPYFKEQNYYLGIVASLKSLFKDANIQVSKLPKTKKRRSSRGTSYGLFDFIFFGIFLLFSIFGRSRRGYSSGYYSGGSSWSSSSSSYSGGSWGGGGGMSSGGGASGSW